MQRLVVKGALQSARFIVPRHLKFTRHHKAFSVQKPALFSRLFATFNGNADKIAQSESILQKAAEQLESGDAEGALKEYQESLDLHPSSAAHYNIGNIYFQLGQMDKARDSWLRSIEMDQMHADAYVNLGNMELMFNQQPEKALEHYKRAEQLEPDDGEIVFNLAVTYDKLNEWEKAVETYRRAKQLLASVENPDEGVKARLERIEPMIRNAITKALASKESAERKQESQ